MTSNEKNEKGKTRGAFDRWFYLKIIIIGIMIGLLLMSDPGSGQVSIISAIIVTIVVLTVFRRKHPENYQKDERTRRIGAYAAAWSWQISFFFVAMLYWLYYLDMIAWSAEVVISAVFVIMIASVLASRAYLMRRGDVS